MAFERLVTKADNRTEPVLSLPGTPRFRLTQVTPRRGDTNRGRYPATRFNTHPPAEAGAKVNNGQGVVAPRKDDARDPQKPKEHETVRELDC